MVFFIKTTNKTGLIQISSSTTPQNPPQKPNPFSQDDRRFTHYLVYDPITGEIRAQEI